MHQLSSPYQLGARRGASLGLALCVMFFAGIYSEAVPLLGIVSALIFIGVPFWIYRCLRSTYVADKGLTALSGLWMQGIVIFGGGSVILALVSTVYMKWVEPDFVINMIYRAIDTYSSIDDPQSEQVAEVLQRMVDAHAVPTASSIAMEIVWLSIFSGSMVSLLMALLAKMRSVPQDRGDSEVDRPLRS